jgi:hypothetical protein
MRWNSGRTAFIFSSIVSSFPTAIAVWAKESNSDDCKRGGAQITPIVLLSCNSPISFRQKPARSSPSLKWKLSTS